MEATIDDVSARQRESISEKAQVRLSDVTASQETMKEMARETGGKAYINQNEISNGVTSAMQDNNSSYTIGYYPEDKKWDGQYRSVKVQLNREGVDVRHRRGYFALDPTQDKQKKPEQEVGAALQDSVPDTLVSFRAQMKSSGAEKLGIDFLVDANTVSAEDVSGGKKLNVVFYAASYSVDGRMLGNQSMKVDQTFPAETYQQILQHGILLHLDLDPKPGSDEVRLAVHDTRTGHLGTLVIPQRP